MWQMCKPAVVAGAWQLCAIVALTSIGLIYQERHQFGETYARLTASLQRAAERIRMASRSMNPSNPNQAAMILLVQLAIGTLGFLAPLLARDAGVDERAASPGSLAVVASSALYSIAVAGLGTMVRAVQKAVAPSSISDS